MIKTPFPPLLAPYISSISFFFLASIFANSSADTFFPSVGIFGVISSSGFPAFGVVFDSVSRVGRGISPVFQPRESGQNRCGMASVVRSGKLSADKSLRIVASTANLSSILHRFILIFAGTNYPGFMWGVPRLELRSFCAKIWY